MFRFTEKVGSIEQTYEAETVQGLVNLRNALNPEALVLKEESGLALEELKRIMDKANPLFKSGLCNPLLHQSSENPLLKNYPKF